MQVIINSGENRKSKNALTATNRAIYFRALKTVERFQPMREGLNENFTSSLYEKDQSHRRAFCDRTAHVLIPASDPSPVS
jgi:hypothetical protein